MLTIAFLTSRKNPRLHWFLDSLSKQIGDLPHELIVVDFWAKEPNREADIRQGRDYPFLHTTPKPTPWQGEYRQTSKNYFAPANARNTAAILAKGSHIAFVDDLLVLMPGWVDQVKHCYENNYVMCGAYWKVKNMQVEAGELVSYDRFDAGIDSRWSMGNDAGIVRCGGGQMYGCSFCLPLSAYVAVNGQDEACDANGGEDYFLGLNLEKAGYSLWYNRNAHTIESEEAHYEDEPMIRVDKPMGNTFSSNVLLDKLNSHRSPITFGNTHTIAEQREMIAKGQGFPLPRKNARHWVDNQLLSEM